MAKIYNRRKTDTMTADVGSGNAGVPLAGVHLTDPTAREIMAILQNINIRLLTDRLIINEAKDILQEINKKEYH